MCATLARLSWVVACSMSNTATSPTLLVCITSVDLAERTRIVQAAEPHDGSRCIVIVQGTHEACLSDILRPGESITFAELVADERLHCPTKYATGTTTATVATSTSNNVAERDWVAHLKWCLKHPDTCRINLLVEIRGAFEAATAPRDAAYIVDVADVDSVVRGDDASTELRQLRRGYFTTLDREGVANEIFSAKRILVMCGAGISVAAGIPDFRSPTVGLYAKLEKYDLPEPAALFTLDYLREKPHVFYAACNEMKLWPGSLAPTHVHHFLKLLEDDGKLLRCYTQNIDGLERLAGLNPDRLVEAHGTFVSAHCINSSCRTAVPIDVVKAHVDKMEVPYCPLCHAVVKPDVVFFGESLPARFWTQLPSDVAAADLLLVIGTSLAVEPFAGIHASVSASVPRVLINMEPVGEFKKSTSVLSANGKALVRDLFLQGDCQRTVTEVAELLNWGERLNERYAAAVERVGVTGKL